MRILINNIILITGGNNNNNENDNEESNTDSESSLSGSGGPDPDDDDEYYSDDDSRTDAERRRDEAEETVDETIKIADLLEGARAGDPTCWHQLKEEFPSYFDEESGNQDNPLRALDQIEEHAELELEHELNLMDEAWEDMKVEIKQKVKDEAEERKRLKEEGLKEDSKRRLDDEEDLLEERPNKIRKLGNSNDKPNSGEGSSGPSDTTGPSGSSSGPPTWSEKIIIFFSMVFNNLIEALESLSNILN